MGRERIAFGKPLSEDSVVRHNVARSRMEIDQVSKVRFKKSYDAKSQRNKVFGVIGQKHSDVTDLALLVDELASQGVS